jgi:methyl-accepting chemotaxis protein
MKSIFARLSFRHMLIMLTVAFLFPTTVTMTIAVRHFRGQMATLALEQSGVDYVSAMLPVLQRRAAGVNDLPAIARMRATTDALDGQYDSAGLMQRWLAAPPADREGSMAARALVDRVVDRSGLALDAEPDSYYLADAAIMKSAMLDADLATLAAAIDRVDTGKADAGDRRLLALLNGGIASQRLILQTAYEKARNAALARGDHRIADQLGPLFDATWLRLAAAGRKIQQLDRGSNDDSGQQSLPHEVASEADRARSSLIGAQSAGAALLGTLIREHRADVRRHFFFSIAVIIGALLPTLMIIFQVLQQITQRTMVLTDRMRGLVEGDLDGPIPFTGLGGELGKVADTLLAFQASLIERVQLSNDLKDARQHLEQAVRDISARNAALEAESETQRKRAAAEERGRRATVVRDLEQMIGQVLSGLLSRAGTLGAEADIMSTNAASSRNEAAAAEQSTRNALDGVMIVATAIDQLAMANAEIRRLMQEVSLSVDRTRTSVGGAQSQVGGLARASARIGEVIELIAQIASQTRLLALNASIEAARAGEAGNGFAVVASEVKALASRAAAATRDVEQHIQQMRNEAGLTIASINEIGVHVSKVSDHALLVASAVDQQSSAANEIALNAASAAHATSSTSDAVAVMAASAAHAHESAQTMRSVANDVTEQAGRLKLDVDHFVAREA